jgi:hypothetical protein
VTSRQDDDVNVGVACPESAEEHCQARQLSHRLATDHGHSVSRGTDWIQQRIGHIVD